MKSNEVQVTIDGKHITAPASLSAIQAQWYAGECKVEGVGCLEGVCGTCNVLVRTKNNDKLTTALGCQVIIEDGMTILFLDSVELPLHSYQLSDIKSFSDSSNKFHQIFPEAKQCRSCGGCDKSCPKNILVEDGVKLACKGKFQKAAELFAECVMCNLCVTSCPENISPNHVGLFSRRVNAHFNIQPNNLKKRLDAISKGELTIKMRETNA